MVDNAALSLHDTLSKPAPIDLTPHIGTAFTEEVQLSALLADTDSDAIVKNIAQLVSHRGVVFFRNQDLTLADQKTLARRLGKLSGGPQESGLHKHPISKDTPELGKDTSVITSEGGIARSGYSGSNRASRGWHADITFEKYPSDYAVLKMHTLPRVGGDTLWASGYEAYDRLSPAMRKFLEGLTAFHDAAYFRNHAKDIGMAIVDDRGHPENCGGELCAVHPVIRTNPVSGYKSLFVNREFTKRIVELSPDESDLLLDYLTRHIAENHDLQVRYRWSHNDIAIWDNRSALHTATNDYPDLRVGHRVVSIGERPYFDPSSKSRRAELGIAY